MTAHSPRIGGARPVSVPPAPGPGSVTWKVHAETVLLAGWGRAILLQLAHPLVAEGVARHSAFRSDPWGGMRRLRATLGTMLELTFGTEHQVARAAARINAIHDRVHGVLEAARGPFPAGTAYSARDPALLAWVHATLLDSFLLAYERFVAPLTDAERDRYCQETARLGPALGIPPGRLPGDHAALSAYVGGMLAGGEIAVTDTARLLARDIVDRPIPRPLRWAAWPLVALARLPAVGLLPSPVREAYGFRWGRRQERGLDALAAAARAALPWLPSPLRHWPAARAARRARP